MSLLTTGLFVVVFVLVSRCYPDRFKIGVGLALVCLAWYHFVPHTLPLETEIVNFALACFMGSLTGWGVGKIADGMQVKERREMMAEYSDIIKDLPEFTEIKTDTEGQHCFLIEDGEYSAHVFLITRLGKEEGEYVYADICDTPMKNKEVTKKSREIGELLLSLVLLREDLGYYEPCRD